MKSKIFVVLNVVDDNLKPIELNSVQFWGSK